MQRKLKKRKSSHVFDFGDNVRVRAVPAVIGGLLLAVLCAVLVALIYVAYKYLVFKWSAVGVAVPIILYILAVMVSSYVAANYFNTRSLVPSISVGGLWLLMSITYSVSAYGWAELLGVTIPLKILFTLVGVIAGYFLVDVIYLPFLPVREQDDSYFMDDEYDIDYDDTYNLNDDADTYQNFPKY